MAITAKGLIHLGYTHNDFKLYVNDDGDVYIKEWNHSDAQPTEEEITAADTQWHIENDYKNNRIPEYPSIGDQLDALFHAGVFPEDMAATIQAVKDKYPKE